MENSSRESLGAGGAPLAKHKGDDTPPAGGPSDDNGAALPAAAAAPAEGDGATPESQSRRRRRRGPRRRHRPAPVAESGGSAAAAAAAGPVETVLTAVAGRSVKYLTCYYWRTNGHCKKTEEECLYSHHDTGLYADKPRPARPGGPTIAGRNLRNAQRRHEVRDGNGGGVGGGHRRNTGGPAGGYQFIPPSVERLALSSPPGPTHAQEAPLPPVTTTLPGPMTPQQQAERRLTVGANRPAGPPGSWGVVDAAGTPVPTANGGGHHLVNYPYGAPATPMNAPAYRQPAMMGHPAGPSNGVGDSGRDAPGSLDSIVQTTKVARRLDQALCDLMRGLVDVSKMVTAVQQQHNGSNDGTAVAGGSQVSNGHPHGSNGHGNGNGSGAGPGAAPSDLPAVQRRIRDMFVAGNRGRNDAREEARHMLDYGDIFEARVVE